MIHLTRLNHDDVLVNSDLIVLVEANPDTVISLTTGERVRVRESMHEIARLVMEHKRLILHTPPWQTSPPPPSELVLEEAIQNG